MSETETQRLFFALWPDDAVRGQIRQHISQLAVDSYQGKPLAADNLHITLRYVGAVDARQAACLRAAADAIVLQPFELALDHQDYWSGPRVAWLGCHQVPPALLQLVAGLEAAVVGCGLPPEPRPYVPHLTLMRKVRHFPAAELSPIHWPVESFVLVLSETRPEGVRYTVLQRWPV